MLASAALKLNFYHASKMLTHDIDIAILSVRLSVRLSPVLYQNDLILSSYIHTYFLQHIVARSF